MNTIPFVKLWPGGNTTAIVKETVARARHAEVAQEIMKEDKEVEQVGYIEEPNDKNAAFRLQMMGGEFCVNATRSAAFLWAKEHQLSDVTMEVSGSDTLLNVQISEDTTVVSLPGAFYLQSQLERDYTVIDLAGIRHIILEGNFDEAQALGLIEKYKENYEAVGVIYIEKTPEYVKIDPLIWVRETASFVRETGCGSGSIATAIALHQLTSSQVKFSILQPSGEAYEISLEPEKEGFKSIQLKGIVKLKTQ